MATAAVDADTSSDGCIDICDICSDDNNVKSATAYCCECGQFLCTNCHKAHQRVRVTKDHHCLVGNKLPQTKEEVILEKAYIFCTIHEDKILECYCQKHDMVCCSFCVLEKHQSCTNIRKLSDKATGVRQSAIFSQTYGQMPILLEGFQAFIKNKQQEIERGEKQFQSAFAAIDVAYEFARIHLDKLAADAKKRLAECREVYIAEVIKTLHDGETTMQQLQLLASSTKRALENASDERTFIVLNSQTQSVEKYERELKKLQHEIQNFTCSFHADQGIKAVEQLGSIECFCISNGKRTKVIYNHDISSREEAILSDIVPGHIDLAETNTTGETKQSSSQQEMYGAYKKRMTVDVTQASDDTKKYDRTFLLKFRYASAANVMPKGLPDIPGIILQEPERPNSGNEDDRNVEISGGKERMEFKTKYFFRIDDYQQKRSSYTSKTINIRQTYPYATQQPPQNQSLSLSPQMDYMIQQQYAGNSPQTFVPMGTGGMISRMAPNSYHSGVKKSQAGSMYPLQGTVSYAPNCGAHQAGPVYYNPGQPLPSAPGQGGAPQTKEKKKSNIQISDPTTGKHINDYILNSSGLSEGSTRNSVSRDTLVSCDFPKELDLMERDESASVTPATGFPLAKISEQLVTLIVHQKANNEQVFDWIESNVDESTTGEKTFIRALMTAVCRSVITGAGSRVKVDQRKFGNRKNLLQKYLGSQPELELQALYALQALATKLEHPPGVLQQMFEYLYDEEVISEDVFLQWKECDDTQEQDGKEIALKQLVPFFTWLIEDDPLSISDNET